MPPTPERFKVSAEGTKRCRTCDDVKPVEDFYRRDQGQRFMLDCKVCIRARELRRYYANSDAVIARVAQWGLDHPDQRKSTQAAYRDRNRPAVQKTARDGAKRRRQEDPTKHRGYDRSQTLHRRGITQSQFDAMLDAQGGACAICGTSEPKGRGTWHIDHCHDTGRIRGLLCHGCNTGLGCLGEDADRVQAAADYLRR